MSNSKSKSVMPLELRPVALAEAQVLRDLSERTFVDAFAAVNPPEDLARYVAQAFSLEQIQSELADSAAHFYFACLGQNPVGYLKLKDVQSLPAGVTLEKPVQVQRLYVEQHMASQGIGAQLMRLAFGEAERLGYRTLWLTTWEENTRSHAFYRRFGFERVGLAYFTLGSRRHTDLVLACRVPEHIDRGVLLE